MSTPLEQAQANLDSLYALQAGNLSSVSIGGRSVSYRQAQDIIALINFWRGEVSRLQAQAAGVHRTSVKLADFRHRQ